jgi:hypothetical protein
MSKLHSAKNMGSNIAHRKAVMKSLYIRTLFEWWCSLVGTQDA